MRRLLSYMKKYRTATVLAVFCIVLETFLELIIPLIMADMVDVGIANADKAYIFEKGLLMAGCAVVSMVLGAGSADLQPSADRASARKSARMNTVSSSSFPLPIRIISGPHPLSQG